MPKLPKHLSHQDGHVELVEYRVREGERVEKGQVMAVVQNWWARMALKTVGTGYVSKTFFGKGTSIPEGDPLAIIVCDPEDAPKSKETSEIEVIENIREKPIKKMRSSNRVNADSKKEGNEKAALFAVGYAKR